MLHDVVYKSVVYGEHDNQANQKIKIIMQNKKMNYDELKALTQMIAVKYTSWVRNKDIYTVWMPVPNIEIQPTNVKEMVVDFVNIEDALFENKTESVSVLDIIKFAEIIKKFCKIAPYNV